MIAAACTIRCPHHVLPLAQAGVPTPWHAAAPLQIVSLLLLALKQVPEALAQFDTHARLFR